MPYAHILALLALLTAAPAFADAPKPEPMPPPAPPAQHVAPPAYGARDLACQEWSDGCQICLRDANGATQCSTPGIACTPGPITCKVKKDQQPGTEPQK